MSTGLVSVVMCTYNGSRFVGEQVESICGQTHADLEIIIIDDASTDDTYSILQDYAVRDARIQLSRNEKNLGYNLNFNKACASTTGDFIAIADQDDIWQLTKIEVLLRKMREDDIIQMTHCISARFEKFGSFHLKSPKLVNYHAGKDVKNFFLSNFISGHNMLLRRSLLDASMPFPAAVYYDWWLAAMACSIGRIEAVADILVWHRMHDSNATGAAKPKVLLYEEVRIILPQLITIANMSTADRNFAVRLLKYYDVFPQQKFSFPLFFFLLRHSKTLFAKKKRSLPWLSYVKHSWKSARASTLA